MSIKKFKEFVNESANIVVYNENLLQVVYDEIKKQGGKYINLNNIDVSNVTEMNNLFAESSEIITLDISSWDTSNVESAAYMFSDCSKLEEINANWLDFSNCTDMEGIFAGCKSLKTLPSETWKMNSNVNKEDWLLETPFENNDAEPTIEDSYIIN